MSEQNPDCWVIIELSGSAVEGGTLRKVLAGWSGGYLDSDYWRASSGIEKITDGGNYWDIHNHSGSIYHCLKTSERWTGLMGSVFHHWVNQAAKRPEGELSIRHVPFSEIRSLLQV